MSFAAQGRPKRLVHDHFGLQDIIDRLDKPPGMVERDFALVSIAAQLVVDYGDALCFKGGFVLRHVYGHDRLSKDIDSTRRNPPRHKFDAEEIATSLRNASMRDLLTIDPGVPKTDSGRSLDFANVAYRGPLGEGHLALEVSYREEVVVAPDIVAIGEPYYEMFDIPVMAIDEIVAEKLRTLCQRTRPTDLSDLATIFERQGDRLNDDRIRTIAAKKFELVADGDRLTRIESNIDSMGAEYGRTVRDLAPDAPSFAEARAAVLRRIRGLVP